MKNWKKKSKSVFFCGKRTKHNFFFRFSKSKIKFWNFDDTSAQIRQKLLKIEKIKFCSHKGVFTNLDRNFKNPFVGQKFNFFYFQEILSDFKRLHHHNFRILFYFSKNEKKKVMFCPFPTKKPWFFILFFSIFHLRKLMLLFLLF